jgi:NAD(P)H-nitrite reductase large subunit
MLDEIAGELVHEAARADGVHVHYDDEPAQCVRDNGIVRKIITKNGLELSSDCIGIGLGLTINTELLEGTGVKISTGILCDDRLETNVAGIFAAGDAAEFYDPVCGMHYRMGTWNNAGAHGKLVAINMAGGDARYDDVAEYSSKLFTEQTITQFGLSPELRAGLEIVYRVDRDAKHYRALFFEENRLVGGVLIGKGNRGGKRKYVEAIKTRTVFAKGDWKSLLDWTA